MPLPLRNRVLLLAGLASGITYLDRVCLSAAAPAIMAELGLSNMQMAYAFSVFALAYGIFEIPMGWLGDRLHTVIFTDRADGVRLISFRRANRAEARTYEAISSGKN